MKDINHPAILIDQWREQADRLQLHINLYDYAPSTIQARVTCLRECASQLENRLLWSGLPAEPPDITVTVR